MSDPGILTTLDEQTIQSKVVLDYTSRDFTAIRSQLIGLAKGMMPEWNTAGEAPDFGTLLLELFAYMGDVMHFYIDRTASEAFLGTAQRYQSVLYIADMLGYTPIGQQAASVILWFSIDPEAEEAVTIPKGSRIHNAVQNADDLIVFETNTEVTLTPSEPVEEIQIFATEGVTSFDVPVGTCHGTPNTEFVLPNKGVIYGSVRVTTREGFQVVNWIYITDLSLSRPTQAVFTTYIDDDGLTHIVFGDNSSGRVPPVGAEVFCTYRFGKGAAANELAAGAIDTIAAISGLEGIEDVTVRNKNSPVGGTDPESIESMRFSIPRASTRIKQRAVTLNDYAALAMQTPGVAKSVSYGTIYTAVHVRIAPQDGMADMEYMRKLCLQVEDYMLDKIMIGSTVYAEPLDVADLWQDVYIHVLVHVQGAYNRGAVRLQVDQAVRKLLAFDAVDFGTRVSIGSIYRTVLAVQGVEYAELEWLNITPPVDDTDPGQGDTMTTVRAIWRHDTSLTMADPGTGKYRRNHATNPTAFSFSAIDADGATQNLLNLQVGDHLVYSPVGDPTSWQSFVITAVPVATPPTGTALWYQVAVARLDQAVVVDPPTNNQQVNFSALRFTPTPDSLIGARVVNIETNELLIPRITPPLILEPPADVTAKALTSNVVTLTTALPHNLVEGDVIDVTAVPENTEVQTVTPGGTISGGSFTMTLLGVTTPAINWNASAANIKTAINTALPGNTVLVGGGPVYTTAFTLTYTGYGDAALVVINSSLTGTAPILAPATTAVGVGADVFNGTRIPVTAVTASTVSYAKTYADVASVAATGTITQIDPWRPESVLDYPDLEEDERTHDGLWVKAVGGLANT